MYYQHHSNDILDQKKAYRTEVKSHCKDSEKCLFVLRMMNKTFNHRCKHEQRAK